MKTINRTHRTWKLTLKRETERKVLQQTSIKLIFLFCKFKYLQKYKKKKKRRNLVFLVLFFFHSGNNENRKTNILSVLCVCVVSCYGIIHKKKIYKRQIAKNSFEATKNKIKVRKRKLN